MAFLWKHPESQYWMARFYDLDGKRRNRSTKIKAKAQNRKEAQRVADEYEEAAKKQRTSLHVRRVILELHEELTGEGLATLTVRQHFDNWLAQKKPSTKSSTYSFYSSATKKFLDYLGKLAEKEIGEIGRQEITSFRDQEAKRVAPRTANHALKCLRMVFKDAKRDGLIADDPTEFVQSVRLEKAAQGRAFTLEELRAVISVADEEWRSIILFGLYTGQRLSDIVLLTWLNVDLEKAEIRLVTEKTGRVQILPIAPPLLRHLEGLPSSDVPASPLHPRAHAIRAKQEKSGHLSNQFADLMAQAGLREKKAHRATGTGRGGRRERSDLSFHSLRKTATTLMHTAGVPAAIVQDLIGHDSEEIHRVYIKVGREAAHQALSTLPDLLVVDQR